MGARYERDTKGKIINAAYRLFSAKGYEATTVDEIVEASQTSKGSFYHYFESKDALFSAMTFVFDEAYQKLEEEMDPTLSSYEKLIYLNREIFAYIENSVMVDMLTRLFATQLTTHGEKHLLDRNRTYYRLIRRIIEEGQHAGELSTEFTVNEIVKDYSTLERGMLYDWCLCDGEYGLKRYAQTRMPLFLQTYLVKKEK